jgi:hypothetical protein
VFRIRMLNGKLLGSSMAAIAIVGRKNLRDDRQTKAKRQERQVKSKKK